MSTLRAGATGLLLVAFLASPLVAQEDRIDRIDLPDGWRPEGITALDGKLYVGSLADGAIWIVDPADPGSGAVFAEGEEGRVTVGVEADATRGSVWAAGGPTGEIRAYDADAADSTTWRPSDPSGFINDAAATDGAVYLTDSFVAQLQVLRLPDVPEGTTSPAIAPVSLPLSGELEYLEGAFNVNGIVAAPAGLVVVHSSQGALFRVDPETGETFRIDTGDVALMGGDGLELDGDILYVICNSADTVTALRVNEALTAATVVAEPTHPDLDTPTTAALIGRDLWVVNARFGTTNTPETEYWLTRLDAVGGADS